MNTKIRREDDTVGGKHVVTPVAEMKLGYQSTLTMVESVLETCTEEIWEKDFPGAPFWREAYHAIFWMHNHLGPRDKTFQFQPFGVDVDPRLFTPTNNTCTLGEVRGYAAQTRTYIDEVFNAMTIEELVGPDHYDEGEFRCVFHRLMYGLRHVQHHVGKLAAYLDAEGLDVDPWAG